MTGLAGLIVSQACCSQSVTLTDGNEVSVKNLAAIVKENKLEAHVTSHILKWEDTDKYEKMAAKYDIAICSGFACAKRLGAEYPFADNKLAKATFDMVLKT